MPRSLLNQGPDRNSGGIDGSISIESGTANWNSRTSSGVAVGQNVFGSSNSTLLQLNKSVLVGSKIFPAATVSGGSETSIVIGAEIGDPTAACNDNLRNVLIGYASCPKMTNLQKDNVIIG